MGVHHVTHLRASSRGATGFEARPPPATAHLPQLSRRRLSPVCWSINAPRTQAATSPADISTAPSSAATWNTSYTPQSRVVVMAAVTICAQRAEQQAAGSQAG